VYQQVSGCLLLSGVVFFSSRYMRAGLILIWMLYVLGILSSLYRLCSWVVLFPSSGTRAFFLVTTSQLPHQIGNTTREMTHIFTSLLRGWPTYI